jgi:hypothetical protein
LYEGIKKTVSELPTKKDFYDKSVELFDDFIKTRLTSFEEQLNKLETTE